MCDVGIKLVFHSSPSFIKFCHISSLRGQPVGNRQQHKGSGERQMRSGSVNSGLLFVLVPRQFVDQVEGKEFEIVVLVEPGTFEVHQPEPGQAA